MTDKCSAGLSGSYFVISKKACCTRAIFSLLWLPLSHLALILQRHYLTQWRRFREHFSSPPLLQEEQAMKRRQAWAIFCCSLLGFLSVFGCSGGGGGGGGGGGTPPPPPPPARTVILQGRVDDGLQHSPIANAVCRFSDRNGTQVATANADGNGLFRLEVPLDMQGFVRCAPPALSHLLLSTFVSTAGKTAGETIGNLTVS